jgi:hypothetical protein
MHFALKEEVGIKNQMSRRKLTRSAVAALIESSFG